MEGETSLSQDWPLRDLRPATWTCWLGIPTRSTPDTSWSSSIDMNMDDDQLEVDNIDNGVVETEHVKEEDADDDGEDEIPMNVVSEELPVKKCRKNSGTTVSYVQVK